MRYKIILLCTALMISAAALAKEINFFAVAHEDDWQLFMNPTAYQALLGNDKKVVFIHTTAGDGGYLAGGALSTPMAYYLAREESSLRATRFMENNILLNGVNNSADPQLSMSSLVTINGHHLKRYFYKNTVSYFLRLPDGGRQGIGFNQGAGNYQSLQRLYNDGVAIDAVDKSSVYKSWNDLTTTLKAIVDFESYNAATVIFNIHDTDTVINFGDHSDHIHTAIAMQAVAKLKPCVQQNLFLGYASSTKAANLTGDDLYMEVGTWAVTVSGLTDSYHKGTWGDDHNKWLSRNYFKTIKATTPCAVNSYNLALQANASASSEFKNAQQTANKAIDGVVGGWPLGSAANEWSSYAQGVGAYLNLSWSKPVTISHAILYDRPNANDQITAAHLVFDNNVSVAVPLLNNNGTATEVSFTPMTTQNLKLVIDGVSVTTKDVGLAEIQLY